MESSPKKKEEEFEEILNQKEQDEGQIGTSSSINTAKELAEEIEENKLLPNGMTVKQYKEQQVKQQEGNLP